MAVSHLLRKVHSVGCVQDGAVVELIIIVMVVSIMALIVVLLVIWLLMMFVERVVISVVGHVVAVLRFEVKFWMEILEV